MAQHSNDDKFYTDLDEQLQNLATMDWASFAKIIGDEAILMAKVYMLRSRGNSFQQIANRLDISKSKVQYCINNQCTKIPVKNKMSE